MLGKLFSIAVLGVLLQYYNTYRTWLDIDKPFMYKKYPGPCSIVMADRGSEDVKHIGNGIVLVSQGLSTEHGNGRIKALDLNGAETLVMDVNITNAPLRQDFMESVHGLNVWTNNKTGQQFLYIVTHPPKEDRVEVFEILKPLALKYVKTITDPKFTFLNALVVVGKDKFYTTVYGKYQLRDRLQFFIESLINFEFGKILYYDGQKAREVASNFFQPNGINISPDQKIVYMAEPGRKRLYGFRREESNNLIKLWDVDMGTAVDNIDVDSTTGDLWTGCHPVMWKMQAFLHSFDAILPSQVLRVKVKDNMVDMIEEVFADDGHTLTGTSSATLVKNKLVIGTVWNQTMVCDVKYHS